MLVLSSVTASGATSGIVKTTKRQSVPGHLENCEQHVHQSDLTRQKKFTHYEIYRKAADGKQYAKVASVQGTSHTDRRLKKNTLYQYKVRPYRYIKGKKKLWQIFLRECSSYGHQWKGLCFGTFSARGRQHRHRCQCGHCRLQRQQENGADL